MNRIAILHTLCAFFLTLSLILATIYVSILPKDIREGAVLIALTNCLVLAVLWWFGKAVR